MRTVVEKVVEYLMTHKKSSTVKQLAKYFIVSEGSVSRALCDLVKEQKVERIQTRGSPTTYRWSWSTPKRLNVEGVELPAQETFDGKVLYRNGHGIRSFTFYGLSMKVCTDILHVMLCVGLQKNAENGLFLALLADHYFILR